LPCAKKAARNTLLRLKMLGSGFVPQAGISQKSFKYSYAEFIEGPSPIPVEVRQTAVFCFPSLKLPSTICLPHHASDWPIKTTFKWTMLPVKYIG